MAQSSQALMLQEGLESYHNSPKFSDVRIKISRREDRPRKRGKKDRPEEEIEVAAHKIILAAGSSAFRDYFQTHEQETSTDGCELHLDDIYRATDDVATSVLRYLYGLTIFQEGTGVCYDWKGLCDAADGFGIPSLRKHTTENLEEHLHGLLKKGLSLDDLDDLDDLYDLDGTSIERFVDVIQTMEWDEDEDSEMIQMVAKLSCRYFTKLREHKIFNEFTYGRPEFSRIVLEYAARKGLLDPR